MALSDKQVEHVCLLGKGHLQCRYLSWDGNPKVPLCAKLSGYKSKIDIQTEKHIKKCETDGITIKDEGSPMGDNCPGYHALINVSQGFDV